MRRGTLLDVFLDADGRILRGEFCGYFMRDEWLVLR